jgi:carboxyl-terminal processing protease
VLVGVVELPSFYGGITGDSSAPSTSADVEELLLKLQALGAEGIVLDLRRNGGGLLSESVRLTGLFIEEGPVVQVRHLNGRVRTDSDTDPRVVYTGPLVVLVSRNSASASEITAGALQALGRAVIVGDRTTHGKGTVQQPVPLNDLRTFSKPFQPEQPWA